MSELELHNLCSRRGILWKSQDRSLLTQGQLQYLLIQWLRIASSQEIPLGHHSFVLQFFIFTNLARGIPPPEATANEWEVVANLPLK